MSEQDSGKQPERPTKRRRVRHGLVIVNTGEGKGKTTAALGVIFRAWGRDFRIRMFQFIKHTGARFGEQRAAKKLDIPIEALGDGFTWLSKDMDRTTALAVEQWRALQGRDPDRRRGHHRPRRVHLRHALRLGTGGGCR